MQLTLFQTYNPPAIGVGVNPLGIARGTSVPVRALVRNAGAVLIFLGGTITDAVDSAGVPSSGTYRLAPNTSEVFVLAPEQVLYAISAGAGGTVSVSLSEAIPIDGGL